MTKEEFKKRWESDDSGGGITFDDVAECYTAWGFGSTPRIKPLNEVTYAVLKAAATEDADDYEKDDSDDYPV